jgi:DNA-binding PadR family transcriptional regulator
MAAAKAAGLHRLQPGSTYRVLAEMVDAGWIREEFIRGEDRRRTYWISAAGIRRLNAELDRMRAVLAVADRYV